MAYKVLSHYDLTLFNRTVNYHLEEGWLLYGNPFTVGDRFCQAITHRSNNGV